MNCDCCNNELPEDDRPQCAVQDVYGNAFMLSEPNPAALYARSYSLCYEEAFAAIAEARARGIHPVTP